MEGADEDSLGTCLLRWIQSFEAGAKLESLRDLGDGLVLWSVLRDVDAAYFAGDLPEPEVNSASDWTRKWQNLKHVEKQVSMYYRDVCNGQEQVAVDSVPDLKAIAEDSSTLEIERLIMVIIRAAMASTESNQKMAQRLMSLGRDSAMVIANELRSMEDTEYTESEPVSRDESAYQSEQEGHEESKANGARKDEDMYQDPLLEREEELLQAQSTIDRLQSSYNDVQRQVQESRQDREKLQQAFDSYRNEIETKGRKTAGDDAFKKLQRQTENDRAYIEELEGQLQTSKNSVESYERQMYRQKEEIEVSQRLRDELQLLKADNEDLNQKIKANENLKKKIQTLQEQEKTSTALREEVKEANERLQDLDRLKGIQASLEKEVIEKQGLIRNQEYQINELTTTRKHAEYDARTLAQKLQEARERHDRDHETIQELKAKLPDSGVDDVQEDSSAAPETSQPTAAEGRPKIVASTNDESKHLAEKVTLLQQQLEASDIRLKQASERNAALEEQQHGSDTTSEARRRADEKAEEHEHTIASLRKDLELATRERARRPAPPQDLAALQRENHLMATAWYDLSSRLQNNGVSLGRRRQEPRSWIGKQRVLVGPSAPAGRS